MKLLRHRESIVQRRIACLVREQLRGSLQRPMAPMRPFTLLSNGDERKGGCTPQFLGCLKVVSGREFPVRGCEKLAGGS